MENLRTETIERQRVHQEAIATNFHEGIQPLLQGESDEVQLRSYQPPVLQELDDFMVETRNELGRAILIPQAGNFGKSFMSVVSMHLAGVGRSVPETGERLRGLFLTSRTVGVQQGLETFNTLTPQLNVRYFSKDIDPELYDDTDVFILTYMTASTVAKTTWEHLVNNRDIVALDEAHRAIGPKIAARLLMAREMQHPTILASTATPKYNELHNVTSVLNIDRSTSSTTPRDAIHMGAANEAKLIALHSGQAVTFTAPSHTIMSEKDIEPLARSAARNNLILNTMADMAEASRPGIVQLIPGHHSKHARDMARWASRKDVQAGELKGRCIVDPNTGKRRAMRVEALGKFQTRKKNLDYIDQLLAGELDALTFTKYITEVFDAPNGLGYVFNGSPLGSWVDANQLGARGARFFQLQAQGRSLSLPTLYFSLVDDYASSTQRRIYTFFDVFECPRFFQGLQVRRQTPSMTPRSDLEGGGAAAPSTVALGESESSTPPYTCHPSAYGKTPLFGIKLSETVLDAANKIPAGTILDEMLLVRPVTDEVPEGYAPLTSLKPIREGRITVEGAVYVLTHSTSQSGQPLYILARTAVGSGSRPIRYALAKEAEALLDERAVDPTRSVRFIEINAFLETLGWPHMGSTVYRVLFDEVDGTYTAVYKGLHSSAEDTRKILLRLMETPFINPEEEVPVTGIARVMKLTSTAQLARLIRTQPAKYAEFARRRRQGVGFTPYRLVDALAIEGMAKVIEEAAEKSQHGATILNGPAKGLLADTVREIGIDNIIARVQQEYRDNYKKAGIDPTALTQDAIDQFLAPYEKRLREVKDEIDDVDDVYIETPRAILTTMERASLVQASQAAVKPRQRAARPIRRVRAPFDPTPSKSHELIPPPEPLDLTHALSGLDNNWVDYSACLDEDAELFFNIPEDDTPAGQKQIAAAKAICANCVVKGDCLKFALASGSEGIFGGLSYQERRKLSDEARRWIRIQPTRPLKPKQ